MAVRLTPRRSALAVLAAAVAALVTGALRLPPQRPKPRPSRRTLARRLARQEALAHLRMAASRIGDALGRRTA